MSIERIFPPSVPSPRGPYSPAVRAGDFIFVSGQGPIDPATDKLSPGDIKYETRLVLSNIQKILEGCGATMADVVTWAEAGSTDDAGGYRAEFVDLARDAEKLER